MVRFGAYATVIDVARKLAPRRFAEDIPTRGGFHRPGELHDHFQPGVGDKNIHRPATDERVMQVVKAGGGRCRDLVQSRGGERP